LILLMHDTNMKIKKTIDFIRLMYSAVYMRNLLL
jgi:hypothetical protein